MLAGTEGTTLKHCSAGSRRPRYVRHCLVPLRAANLEKFGVVQPDGGLVAARPHNTRNVIWISELRHQQTTDWYNEIAPRTNRRRWEVHAALSFDEQHRYALKIMRRKGALK